MNKQEAIKLVHEMAEESYKKTKLKAIHVDSVVNVISQIDEPEKVVIPRFVAEWIEECRTYDYVLKYAYENAPQEVERWLEDGSGNISYNKFARAWLDGYEIEQEQLYKVNIPGTTNNKNNVQYLCHVPHTTNYFFCAEKLGRFQTEFSKLQLIQAGFGWVFECEGVEVQEVTE